MDSHSELYAEIKKYKKDGIQYKLISDRSMLYKIFEFIGEDNVSYIKRKNDFYILYKYNNNYIEQFIYLVFAINNYLHDNDVKEYKFFNITNQLISYQELVGCLSNWCFNINTTDVFKQIFESVNKNIDFDNKTQIKYQIYYELLNIINKFMSEEETYEFIESINYMFEPYNHIKALIIDE